MKDKIGVLFSSGKDSMLALTLLKEQGHEIACLLTIESENPDSYMYHTPNIRLTELQAKSLNLPILTQKTKGEKEIELKDLKSILKNARSKYNINAVATGALFSEYQKSRIEMICNELSLKTYNPLWHMDQKEELNLLMKKNIIFIITQIAAEGLNKSWLNRPITASDIESLAVLPGINPAGEGGEYETLVVNSPLFKKPIEILKSEIVEHSKHNTLLIIKEAKLKYVLSQKFFLTTK